MFQSRDFNSTEIELSETKDARKTLTPKDQQNLLLYLAAQFKKYNRFEQYSLYVFYVLNPDSASQHKDLRALQVLASSTRDFAAITDKNTLEYLTFLKDSLKGIKRLAALLQNAQARMDNQICTYDRGTDATLAYLAALPLTDQTAILKRLQPTTLQHLSSRIHEFYETVDFNVPPRLIELHDRITQLSDQTPSVAFVTTNSFIEPERKQYYNPPSPNSTIDPTIDNGIGLDLDSEFDSEPDLEVGRFNFTDTPANTNEQDEKKVEHHDLFNPPPKKSTVSPHLPRAHQPLPPLFIPPNPSLNTTLDEKHYPPQEKHSHAMLALAAAIDRLKINNPHSKLKKQVKQMRKKFEAVQDNINALYFKTTSQSERDALLTAMEKTTKVLRNEISAQDYLCYAKGLPGRKASPEQQLVGALMIVAATALAALSAIIFAGTIGLGTGAAFGIATVSLGLGFQGHRFFTQGPDHNLAQSMMEAGKVTSSTPLSKHRIA